MFTLLKYLLRNENPPTYLGANLDVRSVEEKSNDIHFKDIVASANAVDWTTKTNLRSFPVYNQYNTAMCGANALSKALGIAYSTSYKSYVGFSRADIYQRRFNKPSGGMSLPDMFKIASEGVTLEQLTPLDIRKDSDADNLVIESFKRDVGKVFSVSGGAYLSNDIETIASVIQTTGKGVILLTYFNSGEWSKETPYIVDLGLTVLKGIRHFVTAVDFTLKDGKKYLVIEDSAWFGGINRRFISEEWVNKRVYAAGYPINFKFSQGSTSTKPSFDGSIISVQKCLRYEGLFPNNISYVESLGPITKKALALFQSKHGLMPLTSTLSPETISKLKELYP